MSPKSSDETSAWMVKGYQDEIPIAWSPGDRINGEVNGSDILIESQKEKEEKKKKRKERNTYVSHRCLCGSK